jgi:transcription antitermination factor NusG
MAKVRNERLLEECGELHWYCLRIAPQKEFVAQEILKRRGLVTFVPSEHRWRRKNKYTKMKELRRYPLMVRYLFIGFTPGVPLWFNLFSIPIIQSVVGVNGVPWQFDTIAVRRLIEQYHDGLVRPTQEKHMRTNREFGVGDSVRIVEGPFEGIVAPVRDITRGQAHMFAELFNGEVPLKIDLNKLEAA